MSWSTTNLTTLKLKSYHPRREGNLFVNSKLNSQDMGFLTKSSQTKVHHFHLPSSKDFQALTHLIT